MQALSYQHSLFQWYSNVDTGQFGDIYLWEINEEMEEEIRTMYRAKLMIDIGLTIHRSDAEAIPEGDHSIENITFIGLTWINKKAS